MLSRTLAATVPTLDEARRLVQRGNLIPVYREVLADMETPVSVYRKISRDSSFSFLLESVEGGERLARYSFLGAEPRLTATLQDGVARVHPRRGRDVAEQRFDDPLEFVKGLLARYRPVPLPDLPRFQGGAVGYLAYECVRYFERLPTPARDDLRLPDAVLMLADTLVVFDHVKHRMRILSHADVEACEGDVERAYGEAEARIEALVERIQAPLSVTHSESERRNGAGPGPGGEQTGWPGRGGDRPARGRAPEHLHPGRVRRGRGAGRGVHPGRGHHPGGAQPAPLPAPDGAPLQRLPRPAGDQPLPLHVPPAPGRHLRRGGLPGDAGAGGGRHGAHPPHRRHPPPGEERRRGRGARRGTCWGTRRSGRSTSCWWTWGATTWGGSARPAR